MKQRKLFSLILVMGIIALSSCGKERGGLLKNWVEKSDQKRILCTTAQIGDLVQAIGGSRIKTLILIQGDLDPHSYEIVKGDGEKVQAADLIFYNGLNLEHGVSLSQLLRASPNSVPIGDAIALAHPEAILKKDSVIDPHLWMDVSTWAYAICPILDALVKVDPEGKGYFEERAEALIQEMEKMHTEIREKLLKIPPERRYLLTSHDAFRYFARAYLAEEGEANWEDRFAAPEGLAPDGQLSSLDIQRMIDFVRKFQATVLFPESNVSRDSIKKIAHAGKELGLDVTVCKETLYGDSMSGLSYFQMMKKNADVLARYLANDH